MLRRLCLCVLAFGALAAPAAAQIPPPSLTADTGFAFAGISEYDFGLATADDARRAAADPGLDRYYAVGSTAGQIAVVARRGDGSLDSGFAGDGSLALADGVSASDIIVLADHTLRVLGVSAGGDIVVVGLKPDGSLNAGFGTGGVVSFSAGAGTDVPGGLAVDPATGRLAITGGTALGDTFMAVRSADGSAISSATVDLAPGLTDRGVDVAWGPSGPAALVAIDPTGTARSAIHTFSGVDTEVTFVNVDDVVPGALMAYGGALWAVGTVVASGDSDVWLARADGSLETRRFDIRGTQFPAPQPVSSEGFDLTVAPGDPDTLVVGGQATTDRGTEWAMAAFNGLDGPLSALQSAELVVPIASSGGARGVAGAPGGVVFGAGGVEDQSSHDFSIGMGRALVDAEKRCDLSLSVPSPVELVMRGVAPGAITVRVANNGQRPCSGTLTLPAPWGAVGGALDLGRLVPGASVTEVLTLAYGAALPQNGTLELGLSSPTDAAPGDNLVRLPVTFSFCDLQLSVLDAPPVLGTEGARTYSFTVRNVGTLPCRGAQVLVGAPGRLAALPKPFSVDPGRSVEDQVDVGVRAGRQVGQQARSVLPRLRSRRRRASQRCGGRFPDGRARR